MTNNYSRIISFINSKKNITNSDKIKFQYVTYQKGVNEFNRGNFKSSIKYFDLSKRYKTDYNIYVKSVLNKSEALFIGNLFNEAKNEILEVINSKINNELKIELALLLGYSYFNMNEYVNASKYLKTYINKIKNGISTSICSQLLLYFVILDSEFNFRI